MASTSVAKIIIFFFAVSFASCENVLYLHGILSPSHHLWNRVVARELAGRGHNVTFLSVDNPKGETENLHYIVFERAYEVFHENDASGEDFDFIKFAEEINANRITSGARALIDYAVKNCDTIYKTKGGWETILSYPDNFKFDVVIYDFTFGPCLLPIIQKFNYPSVIGVTAFLNPPYTTNLIGGIKYPGYVPHFLANLPQHMTFSERIYNLLLYTVEKW